MQDHLIALDLKSFSKKDQRWRRIRDLSVYNTDPKLHPSSLHIFSWNVDFTQRNRVQRLYTVIDHIRSKLPKSSDGVKPVPCCILFQEVALEAVPAVLGHPWVKEHFQIVPYTTDAWPHGARYGVVTLVSRSLFVTQALSLVFGNSHMGRSALMVDIRMNATSLRETGDTAEDTGIPAKEAPVEIVTLRLANTHLESMPEGTDARPVQLNSVAAMLRDADCGVVCGDMNAIDPSDVNLHAHAGLEDAWRRDDRDPAGFTWGYQPRCQFPVARLDKVLHTPSNVLEVGEPHRIGVGLKTADGQWASDHYGLLTTVRVV